MDELKNHLLRVGDKLDKLDERMDDLCITSAKQEENLREHMRRTELLEQGHSKLHDDIVPIQNHVQQVKGAGKLLAILATAVTVVGAIYQFVIK